MNTAKFMWAQFRMKGWQSAVASVVCAGVLIGYYVRVPRPWGIAGAVTFGLTALGALAFALAPWCYGFVLAQAVRTGVLARAEVVAAPGGTGQELLVPFERGAFRRSFNPKRSWQPRVGLGAHVLVLVDRARPRLLVDFGPIEEAR